MSHGNEHFKFLKFKLNNIDLLINKCFKKKIKLNIEKDHRSRFVERHALFFKCLLRLEQR
jgi:hypothetical protein